MKARDVWRSSFVIAGLLSAGAFAACTAQVGNTGGSGGNGSGQSASGGSSGSGGSNNKGSGGATGSGSMTGKASGGSVGSGSGGASASGSGGSGGSTSSGSGGDMGTGGVTITTGGNLPAESAGTLVMRRLTYREYDHMLNELFGDITAPAEGSWSPDSPNTVGYVAPSSVADLQVENYSQTADAVVDAAIAAAAAGKTAGKLAIPCKTAPTTTAAETTCATQFITTFGLSAYRRPVVAAEQTDLLAVFTKVRGPGGLGLTFNASLGAIAKAMIQSPNFLYHWEIGPTKPVKGADGLVPLTQWQIASRLASMLWETMPDDTLLTAAQAGQLNTAAAVSTQITRMMTDPRLSNGLFNFHKQWLFNFGSKGRDLNQPAVKSSPMFTSAVGDALQTEFTQFVASVYAGDGTLNSLFTAPYAFVNKDLAALYGVTGPATGFAKVSLDPSQRGGIFTQVAFLAMTGNDNVDDPVDRGLSIYLKVLCGMYMNPPMNVPPVNFIANGTTRQSFDKHGTNACSASCHALFDPPGFAFENYDGLGQYRTKEGTLPVDSTGSFTTPGNATITFKNAIDLSTQLAQSSEAQTCVDRQWTRYLLGRPETDAEAGSMALALQKASATTGFSVRDLLTSLLTSKSFMYRQPSPGEAL